MRGAGHEAIWEKQPEFLARIRAYLAEIGSFSSFDVIVRAGHTRTTALDQQTVPAYLTMGVNVPLRW